MRRYLSAVALAAALVLAFSGCSAVQQTESNSPAPRVITTPPPGPGPPVSTTRVPAPTGENRKFFDAVVKDDAATVTAMLKTSKKFLSIRDGMSFTPLLVAATSGDAKCAAALIKSGADVNAANGQGRTALHAASSHNNLDIAKMLIANGANVNARSKNLGTPLHAAVSGNVDVAKYLLAKGANINAATKRGATPLIAALAKGHKEVAKLLVNNGAKLDQSKLAAAMSIKPGTTKARPGEEFCCEDL